MQKIRKGFKPCPNFLWDIEGLKSKDRDVIMYLYSHSKNFIPSLRNIACKCGFGEKNTNQVKKVLESLLKSLCKQSSEIYEMQAFINIRDTVIDLVDEILHNKYHTNNKEGEKEIKHLNATEEFLICKDSNTLDIGDNHLKYKEQVQYYKNNNKGNKSVQYVHCLSKNLYEDRVEIFNQQLKEIKEVLLNMPEINGNRDILEKHYQYFCDYIRNKKDGYVNYVAAFRNAIRGNYAKIPLTTSENRTSFQIQDMLLHDKLYQYLGNSLDSYEEIKGDL